MDTETCPSHMLTCLKCGAVCSEKKDRKRFLRRHPVKCQAFEKFHRGLAAETKSVDYDEQQERLSFEDQA